jgi:hypothetical protein
MSQTQGSTNTGDNSMDYENYLNQTGEDHAEDRELCNNIEEAQREEFLARENKVKD